MLLNHFQPPHSNCKYLILKLLTSSLKKLRNNYMKCNGKISSVLSIQRNAVISLLIFCSNQIFSWSKGTIFLGFLGTWVTTVYLKYQLSVHSTLYFGHAKSFLPRKSSYVRYMQKLLYQLLNSMYVCRRLHFSYPLGATED